MVHKIRRSPVDMENIPLFTWGFSGKDSKFAGFLKHQQYLYHLHLPGSWKKPVHLSVFFHRERLQVASPRCPCGKVDERLGASAFLRSATKVWQNPPGNGPSKMDGEHNGLNPYFLMGWFGENPLFLETPMTPTLVKGKSSSSRSAFRDQEGICDDRTPRSCWIFFGAFVL